MKVKEVIKSLNDKMFIHFIDEETNKYYTQCFVKNIPFELLEYEVIYNWLYSSNEIVLNILVK